MAPVRVRCVKILCALIGAARAKALSGPFNEAGLLQAQLLCQTGLTGNQKRGTLQTCELLRRTHLLRQVHTCLRCCGGICVSAGGDWLRISLEVGFSNWLGRPESRCTKWSDSPRAHLRLRSSPHSEGGLEISGTVALELLEPGCNVCTESKLSLSPFYAENPDG